MAIVEAWSVFAGTEVRVQISSDRYRVPDVCVLRSSDPFDAIVQKAPLICIEILSPEDRVQRMQAKMDDYVQMGVEHIWVIDPISRHAWIALPDGSRKHVVGEFIVPGTPIRASLTDLFGEMDEIRAGHEPYSQSRS